MTELSLKISKTIQAPIERVSDAWLDPALLSRFVLPAPGMPNPEVDNDPREGGRFTIVMDVGGEKVPHGGTYLEISRPNRLSFTWESPFSADGSTVTLEFSTTADGATRVDLGQVKFFDEESRANHEGGWRQILELLAELA